MAYDMTANDIMTAFDKTAYDKKMADKKMANNKKSAYDKKAYDAHDKKIYDKTKTGYDKEKKSHTAYEKTVCEKAPYDQAKYDKAKSGYEKEKKSLQIPSGEPCTDGCACGRADTDAAAKARAHAGRPLRILCLHGGGHSAQGMSVLLSNLTEAFGPLVDFHFAQAPHVRGTPHGKPCGPRDGFLWMGDAQKQGAHSARWWYDSLELLRGFIAERGPFDGVLGHSMGSAAALALLAAVPVGTFRFAVLCCGYVPTNDEKTMASLEEARPLQTPTLHVHGRTDRFTTSGLADGMLEYFAPGANELCRHPGGHTQPYDPRHVNQMAAFLLRFAGGEE